MVIREQIRKEIEAECARFPERRGALLDALHRVQRDCGAITVEAAREMAEIFGMRPIEILEVVRFYNMFETTPRGRHRVRVCTGLSCSLLGARDFLRELEDHLGIAARETTPDGRITLRHEECLGGCAAAPVLWIDDDYHEGIEIAEARSLLDALE